MAYTFYMVVLKPKGYECLNKQIIGFFKLIGILKKNI